MNSTQSTQNECASDELLSRTVTIIYGSLYAAFLISVSIYSFSFLMKYDRKFVTSSNIKKLKIWAKDTWKRKKCYIPIIAHIFDQVTDVSVAIQFYFLANNEMIADGGEWTACNGLNIWYLFILTILSMVIYRVVSSLLIYESTRSCQRFIIQLLDMELLRALYINYLCNNTVPCDPQRWITTLEATLESSPQALIQLIYLVKTDTFTSSPIILVSFISSLITIVSKLISDDKSIVVTKAKELRLRVRWKQLGDIFIDICCGIIYLMLLLVVAIVFIIYFIVICTLCCICGCCFAVFMYFYKEHDIYDTFETAQEMILNGPIVAVFTINEEIRDRWYMEQRFEWISLFYVLRAMWRLIDVSSQIFLMTLIWIIMGGVTLTFKIIIESVILLFICCGTGQWDFLFGIIGMVISTTTENIRKISIGIVRYRVLINIIFMTLITIWLYVDFECWKCTDYEDRREIAKDDINESSMYIIFIYTWCSAVILPICVFLLLNQRIFKYQSSASRSLERMIIAKNYDGIIEMQLYRGQYNIYDKLHNKTLLMLAMQQNNAAVVSYLLDKTNKYDHEDNDGLNILDYYVRISDDEKRTKEPMKDNLIKIYQAHPDLKTKQQFNIFLLACYHGEIECVQELINLNKNILNDITSDGLNGTILAELGNHKDIVQYLSTQNNSETKQINWIDLTMNNRHLIPLLPTVYRTNPRLKSPDGYSAFLCACYYGDLQCIEQLVAINDDVLTEELDGGNGAGYAQIRGHHELVSYFRSAHGMDSVEPKQLYKILILGSGGCGKSTLFKQLRKLYGEGFTNKDKKDAVHGIASFVVETMQTLLEDERCNIEEFKDENTKNAAKQIQNIQINSRIILNQETANNIKILWSVDEIKNIFYETAKLHLNGTCGFFFDSIDRISSPSFDPTDKDILMQRRPTTGLIEGWIAKTEYEYIKFQLVDVGGAKNERRKWIHHFENVAAIVFVTSLSAFDEPLYEDETINSLIDSIQLFGETINADSHWFKQSSLFLVFNKKDLFQQKIINKSLKTCFTEQYDENQYFTDCKSDDDKIEKNIQFIKQKYLNQIKDESKQVKTFEMCGFEEDQVQNIFDKILEDVVNKRKLIPPL